MDLAPSRLRRGELLVGAGAVLLPALMFATDWSKDGAGRSFSGWHAVGVVRWLILLASLAGLALVFAQTTRRAPAIPSTLSMIVTVLGLITIVWLAIRVVIDRLPHEQLGAILGLISACVLGVGGFLSLRTEGISSRDAPQEIPTIRFGERGPA